MSHQNTRLGASRLAVGEAPQEPEGLTLRPSAVTREPVSVSDAEKFLRVTGSQAVLLDSLVTSVRTEAERLSHRLFTRRSVEATWDVFYQGVDLPRPPIDTVATVEAREDDAWVEVLAADYQRRGRRLEVVGHNAGEPLRVTYTAGYEDLPADLRHQMLKDVRHAYDHRDPTMGEVVQDPDVYAQYRPY